MKQFAYQPIAGLALFIGLLLSLPATPMQAEIQNNKEVAQTSPLDPPEPVVTKIAQPTPVLPTPFSPSQSDPVQPQQAPALDPKLNPVQSDPAQPPQAPTAAPTDDGTTGIPPTAEPTLDPKLTPVQSEPTGAPTATPTDGGTTGIPPTAEPALDPKLTPMQSEPTRVPTATPTDGGTTGIPPTVVETAILFLAAHTGLPATDIEVVSSKFVVWPNGAMGCPEPGRMYTQATVPGYEIMLSTDGTIYEVHVRAGVVFHTFICDSDSAGSDLPTNIPIATAMAEPTLPLTQSATATPTLNLSQSYPTATPTLNLSQSQPTATPTLNLSQSQPTATSTTPTATATSTTPPTSPPTATATATSTTLPPTATATSTAPPTATATSTTPPPTATATSTAPPPTATATSTTSPPTATATSTTSPPTATATSRPTSTPTPYIPGSGLRLEDRWVSRIVGDRLSSSMYAVVEIDERNVLYRSRDNGLSWVRIMNAPSGLDYASLSASGRDNFVMNAGNPNVLYSGINQSCTDSTKNRLTLVESAPMYKSENGGISWQALPNSTGLRPLLSHSYQPDVLFATDCLWIYITTDGGQIWTPAQPLFEADAIWNTHHAVQMIGVYDEPDKADTPALLEIYVAGIDANNEGIIVSSTDLGKSWTTVTPLLEPAPWQFTDMTLSGNSVWFIDPNGFWSSKDAGLTWVFTNRGLEDLVATSGLNSITVHPSEQLYLGTTQGLYRSATNATSWRKITGTDFDMASILGILFTDSNPNILYINSDEGVYVAQIQ